MLDDPSHYSDDQYARWLFDHDLAMLELDIINNEPKENE